MTLIKIPPTWSLPESSVTDEHRYLHRREFLAKAGLWTAGAMLAGCGAPAMKKDPIVKKPTVTIDDGPLAFGIEDVETAFKTAARNPEWSTIPEGRVLTDHQIAAKYNNFYEFTTSKKEVWHKVGDFKTRPFTVDVGGLVKNPTTLDIDDLIQRFPAEERIYRFRCVEAWSMVVPWTGFQLSKLLDHVQPTADAKYVRFWTYNNPEQMPGVRNAKHYPWPYFEALSMEEAMNSLTLLATGLYGKPLPRQNGAPIRLIVPWKYGYKSIKSINKIEFVAERPDTFWTSLAPKEYSFFSNVEPDVPHPRWSQATERDIQTNEQVPTLPFNGYESAVRYIYKDTDRMNPEMK